MKIFFLVSKSNKTNFFSPKSNRFFGKSRRKELRPSFRLALTVFAAETLVRHTDDEYTTSGFSRRSTGDHLFGERVFGADVPKN